MKYCLFILSFLLFFNLAQANPFAAKIFVAKKTKTAKATSSLKNKPIIRVNFILENIRYQGKLEGTDKRIGAIVFERKKYSVEEGEVIGNIKIVDLRKDYILLLKDKKLHKINISTNN